MRIGDWLNGDGDQRHVPREVWARRGTHVHARQCVRAHSLCRIINTIKIAFFIFLKQRDKLSRFRSACFSVSLFLDDPNSTYHIFYLHVLSSKMT